MDSLWLKRFFLGFLFGTAAGGVWLYFMFEMIFGIAEKLS